VCVSEVAPVSLEVAPVKYSLDCPLSAKRTAVGLCFVKCSEKFEITPKNLLLLLLSQDAPKGFG